MDSAIDTFFPGTTEDKRTTIWKQILRWESQRDHIATAASTARTKNMRTIRKQGLSTALPSHAEENIAQWVAELRQDGIPVSRTLLTCKAMEVAEEQGLTSNQFKASPSWINGFMKRWRLAIRGKTRSGQANLADGEHALEDFKASIRKVIQDNDIDDIYNADQTGINYEYIPKQTIDKKGAKTVWIKASGHDKDRMTAMLLADAKGTKFPLFLVLKTQASKLKTVVQENLTQRHGFGRRVWREIQDLEANFPLQIYGNPSAWWNSGISLHFLDFHFGRRRDQDVKPVLLLWDDFSAHFTDEVVQRAKDLRVILARVPPTFTWMCQPADVAWMKPIKASMRLKWVSYLRSQVAYNRGVQGKSFRLKCPDRWDIVEWIQEAWDDLPTSTVVKGFEKCKIIDSRTSDVEPNQDDLQVAGSEDDLQELVHMGALVHLDPDDDVLEEAESCPIVYEL
jgi:hypothetical protein